MKYLSIDLGEKRIGIATSDQKGIVAQPLAILKRESDEKSIKEISTLCEEHEVAEIVFGIPYSADEDTQNRYRSFMKKLEEALEIPVHEWDETFSTKQAQNVVAFSDRLSEKKKTKDHRDSVAAAIILQEFLDGKDN